jgi:hypothetical protein
VQQLEVVMGQFWRGIYVIVVTPFTNTYELDEASLRKEIRLLHRGRRAWPGRPGERQRVLYALR